jgi:hypothetical protein
MEYISCTEAVRKNGRYLSEESPFYCKESRIKDAKMLAICGLFRLIPKSRRCAAFFLTKSGQQPVFAALCEVGRRKRGSCSPEIRRLCAAALGPRIKNMRSLLWAAARCFLISKPYITLKNFISATLMRS